MIFRSFKLETAATFHVAVLGVFASWALGGGTAWAATTISVVGGFAPLITLLAIRERHLSGLKPTPILHTLWPLLAFNILVVLGTFQPSFRIAFIEGANVYVPRNDLTFLPSSARPELALKALWLFDATFLTCFNLLLAVRHSRTLRILLLVLAGNTLALAVFGSVQKFSGASGLFFGRIASPNTSFFASFIYHNHWGTFALLMLAVCLGLLFHQQRRSHHRDVWHSPLPAAVVVIFFLAVTIPLCGSRSCSLLAILLLVAALIHGLVRIVSHRHEDGRAAFKPATALVLVALVAFVSLFTLARPSIESRINDSQNQLLQMRSEGSIGGRATLYRDTWRMACDRPWFGWGLGSYGTVFMRYNTQTSPVDRLPVYYQDAHSDWLQLFAETGVIGSLFYLLLLLVPLSFLRPFKQISALPTYLLAGCGFILLYAWIEFPFGNPSVTMTFWTCFFCAVRWFQIEQRELAG